MTAPMNNRDFTEYTPKDIWLLWQLIATVIVVAVLESTLWEGIMVLVVHALFATAWRLSHPH